MEKKISNGPIAQYMLISCIFPLWLSSAKTMSDNKDIIEFSLT